MRTKEGDHPPRVLIVMRDQWRRALLRAALREAGYDAVGARGLREGMLVPPTVPDRGPVRLLVIDQADLATGKLELLSARHQEPATLLLARATVDTPAGDWTRVLRRPFSVADVVDAVQALVPLAESQRHPVDRNRQESPSARGRRSQ